MSSQIDFRTLPANVPVLCIPRVYANISESRIRKIFDDLDMGTLDRIDMVSKTSDKGEKFNRVFVHFRRWNTSGNANIARERLLNGKEIKIIYDDPWFWKISAYREAERKPAITSGGNFPKGKPTLAFDSDEEKSSRPVVSTPLRDSFKAPRDDRRRDDRPRDNHYRPRPGYRNRPHDNRREDNIKLPQGEPRSPSNSPPRERPTNDDKISVDIDNGLNVDYHNVALPPKRRNIVNTKSKTTEKNLVIELEPGEADETL
jgi:hypothetical protein